MSDRQPNRVEFVIQKYRLAETTFIEAEQDGRKLGAGKIMADDTLQRFADSDPSGNLKYLDWMIFQAGGGQEAMEKSLSLWEGDNDADPHSLRNQCKADFIEEQVQGYTDEQGVRHQPVNRDDALAAWKRWEDRSKFEFVMGDQDVSVEEGFGFYRHWPGKNGLYQKIVNTIKLWHSAQAKLLSANQKHDRYTRLKKSPLTMWSEDDRAFMRKVGDSPPPSAVVLDIYSGWKPKEYSQAGAVYKNMDDLLRTLADVRKMQVLKDVQIDKIYEDARVIALCPLTIAASLKYGIGKWCVSNRSEFDRAFEVRGSADTNWQRYNKQGPLVFLCWKVPMPPWLHRMALHIPMNNLRRIVDHTSYSWVDCQNQQRATNYNDCVVRIQSEASRGRDTDAINEPVFSSDERYFKWGGREPGRAWTRHEVGEEVLASLHAAMAAVKRWGHTFDTNRIVLDFVLEVGALVDKSDE